MGKGEIGRADRGSAGHGPDGDPLPTEKQLNHTIPYRVVVCTWSRCVGDTSEGAEEGEKKEARESK